MMCLSKGNLDGDIFFLILLRKIRKKMSLSRECFAAAGGEILFTQAPKIISRRKKQLNRNQVCLFDAKTFST